MSCTMKFYDSKGKVLKLRLAPVRCMSNSMKTRSNFIAFAAAKGFTYTKTGKKDTRRFSFASK